VPPTTLHSNQILSKAEFAECFFIGHSAKSLLKAERAFDKKKQQQQLTDGDAALPECRNGKVLGNDSSFAECQALGTQQRWNKNYKYMYVGEDCF